MTGAAGLLIAILCIALGVAAGVAAALWLRRPQAESPSVGELRSEVHSLRDTTESMSKIFSSQLQSVTTNVQAALTSVTGDLGTRLESINRQVSEQLKQTASQANANTSIMARQLESVQGTFTNCNSVFPQGKWPTR